MEPVVKADFPLYRYRAYGPQAVDGDTIRADLDLGLKFSALIDLRIAGINAPEVVGETKAAGEAARDYLSGLLAGRWLWVRTYKDRRSFARYVADCWLDDGSSIAAAMIAAGHAVKVE